MSLSIWYLSKYISLPSSGRWGLRSFLLMREMRRQGHRPVVFTSDASHLTVAPTVAGSHLVETVDGVDICWVRTRKFDGAKSWGRILSWLDFELRLWLLRKAPFAKPDVVIVSSPSLFTVLNGLWLKLRYRTALVFEVRDIWPLTLVEEGGYSRRNPLIRALALIERLAYRHADVIIGTMPNLIEHVRKTKRHAPVSTIPFGIDDETLARGQEVPDEWLARHWPEGKFVVCYAGTIGITNALELLFECAETMADREDIHFLVVGEGNLLTRYRERCRALSNLSLTGAIPKPMVQSVLKRADLLYFSTLPSAIWRYGMSLNKAIDYLMSGKPVLGSYTGYPTIIEEAGAGSIVSAGDVGALRSEIVRYAQMSEAERRAIGELGPQWLRRHRRYEQLASDYLALLKDAIAHRRARLVGLSPRSMSQPL